MKLKNYILLKPDYDDKVEKLNELKLYCETLRKDIENRQNETSHNIVELTRIESEVTKLQELIKEYTDYQLNLYIYGIYSKLVKNDFKKIVFEYYRKFLNNTLNILLEGLKFKLFWDESGELFMIEIKNGQTSFRPVQLVSGMETCFQGLALIYAIHVLNVKNSVSTIFIDEISGQLNSGKELTNKDSVQNYQEQLILLLGKFNKKNLFIIDHVIHDLNQSNTFEVVASKEGSKFIKV